MSNLDLRLRRYVPFLCFLLTASLAWSFDPSTIEQSKVIVTGLDAQSQPLRTALGFVYDDDTILTSYSALQGAATIRVDSGDYHGTAGRMISSNAAYDLAVIKTDEEMPLDASLASSDTLAAGQPVYYFSHDKTGWQLQHTQVKSWSDSGQGYETIQLQKGIAPAEPSPLYNASGKVIGWTPDAQVALPLKAIYMLMLERTASVPLSDLHLTGKFWSIFRVKPTMNPAQKMETSQTEHVTGPSSFPFQLDIPRNLPFQTAVQANRYLLLAMNGEFGISLGLRVVPAVSEDLDSELERTETMLFPDAPRSEMEPYSSERASGLRALYEDQDREKGYATTAFYAIAHRNLYVLTVTYPQKYSEQWEPFLDDLIASLRL